MAGKPLRALDGGLSPTGIAQLMERFVGLTVDEGRAPYATLTPEEQAALDDRGLKSSWRSMRASEAHQRRRSDAIEEFQQAIASGKRPPPRLSPAMQKLYDEAMAKKARRPGGGA
jgi:hypothetical protein